MNRTFRVAVAAAVAVAGAACGGDTDLRGHQPADQAAPAAAATMPAGDGAVPASAGAVDTVLPSGSPAATVPAAREAARVTADSAGATSAAAPATVTASAKASPGAKATATSGRKRVVLGKVDLTEIGYDKGDPKAPITVVNFSDFGCPYCAQFSLQTYPALEREYVNTGKVYFKYVPFVMGMFPNGDKAARASECAGDQGRFWQMHDRIYEAQRTWKQTRDPWPGLAGLAEAEGLDMKEFNRCVADHRTEPRTRRASRAAEDLGVRATPSFAINGRAVEGALPLEEFRRILDAMLLLQESR
ncbi:MAG TPA: DsbA family protein [Gemmatimonadaceae bacterium]|nr:DsbA family protein [Gemmatimonadaceae bacterium]